MVAVCENEELPARLKFGFHRGASIQFDFGLELESCRWVQHHYPKIPASVKLRLRRLEGERKRVPQKKIAAWVNERLQAFKTALEPSVRHEEMYGGGDESYELDFL